MIAWLRGTLVDRGLASIVLDVGGVGYEVFVPLRAFNELPATGGDAQLHVHTAVREDAITLYGFTQRADRQVFERLLSVSGIGPRLALAALSVLSAQELHAAISGGDINALSRIPGVGRKTAQRIALELSGRLEALPLDGPGGAPTTTLAHDLRLALADLGYGPRQIDPTVDALRDRIAEGPPVQQLIVEALRLLRQG